MIVNQSALISVMKRAYNGSGYTVACSEGGDQLYIQNGFWAVGYLCGETPWKVLGLLAEHMGKLPEPGEAIRVRKKDLQTKIYSVAMEPIGNLLKKVKERKTKRIRPTNFLWKGFHIWQCPVDLKVLAFEPEQLDIAKVGTDGGEVVEGMGYFADDVSFAVIGAMKLAGDADSQAFGILESTQWV